MSTDMTLISRGDCCQILFVDAGPPGTGDGRGYCGDTCKEAGSLFQDASSLPTAVGPAEVAEWNTPGLPAAQVSLLGESTWLAVPATGPPVTPAYLTGSRVAEAPTQVVVLTVAPLPQLCATQAQGSLFAREPVAEQVCEQCGQVWRCKKTPPQLHRLCEACSQVEEPVHQVGLRSLSRAAGTFGAGVGGQARQGDEVSGPQRRLQSDRIWPAGLPQLDVATSMATEEQMVERRRASRQAVARAIQSGRGELSSGEKSGWRYWLRFCAYLGYDSRRRDARYMSVDELACDISMLAEFLVDTLSRMPPGAGRVAPKPSSAANHVRTVRRVHRMVFPPIHLPPMEDISLVLKRMNECFREEYGYENLLTRRREPWRQAHILRIMALPQFLRSHPMMTLAGEVYRPSVKWTSFFALLMVLASCGARKSEVAVEKPKEFNPRARATRASLSWIISGRQVRVPTTSDLEGLCDGDYAVLRPPPSKADPFGIIWGNELIYLPWHQHQPWCAAQQLAELELIQPTSSGRESLPLFCDDLGSALSFSWLHKVLEDIKRIVLEPHEDPRLFTYHSFRIYLATALLSAGVERADVQRACRWLSPSSVETYARTQPVTVANWLRKAFAAEILAYTATSLPILHTRQLFLANRELLQQPTLASLGT